MLRMGMSGAYRKYFNQHKIAPIKYMVQLSATMEQIRETQHLCFRQVIARYVVSKRHETGSSCVTGPTCL